MKSVLIACCLIITAGAAPVSAQQVTEVSELKDAGFQPPVFKGQILNRAIREASGLARSHRNNDHLWLINDSGDEPRLFLIQSDGQSLGEYTVEQTQNRDWEDLSSFELNKRAYLLIADVGDNRAKHETIKIHIVEEPKDLNQNRVIPEWTITATLEGGPTDIESVFVDSIEQNIYLLSKRRIPSELFVLPLKSNTQAVAKRVGTVANIPATSEPGNDNNLLFGSQPTSMDISPDHQQVVVLTYNNMYLYRRQPHLSWAQTLATVPDRVPTPSLLQAEAVTFSTQNTLILTSEGFPAPLLEFHSKP